MNIQSQRRTTATTRTASDAAEVHEAQTEPPVHNTHTQTPSQTGARNQTDGHAEPRPDTRTHRHPNPQHTERDTRATQEQIIITGLNNNFCFEPSRSTRRSLNRPKLFLRSSGSLLHSLIRFPSLLLSLTFPSQSSSNLISSRYCLTNGTVTL